MTGKDTEMGALTGSPAWVPPGHQATSGFGLLPEWIKENCGVGKSQLLQIKIAALLRLIDWMGRSGNKKEKKVNLLDYPALSYFSRL